MKPPGRSNDSSTRQPANGSAMMVEHADALDEVEAAVDRSELENVGLRVFEIGHAKFAGLARRIGEARQAEVDGQHARAGETLRGFDRVLAGAAAGDQDIDFGFAERAECRGGEFVAQVLIDPQRLLRQVGLGPARIGIFLVLLPHPQRHVVLDRRQRRDRGAQSCSSAGSRTCWVRTAASAGGHGLIQNGFDPRQANAAGRRSRARQAGEPGMASPRRNRGDHLVPQPRASAASSSVRAKTCSLMKHCRASAQAKPSTFSSAAEDAFGVRCDAQHREARIGEKSFEVEIGDRRGLQQALQQMDRPRRRRCPPGRTVHPPVRRRGQASVARLMHAAIAGVCLTSFAAAGARSLARPHGSDSARTISARKSSASGEIRQAAQALHEQRLGLRRLAHRQRAPQASSALSGLPGSERMRAPGCCRLR